MARSEKKIRRPQKNRAARFSPLALCFRYRRDCLSNALPTLSGEIKFTKFYENFLDKLKFG